MNTDRQQLLIHIQAKTKHFKLKLKATKYLPAACYNFCQFSLFLKISSLIIRLSSNSNNKSNTRSSLRIKITRVFDCFRRIRNKRSKSFAAHNSSRIEKLKRGSCESSSKKDAKGIIVHCWNILLYILTLLKKFIWTKYSKMALVSILSMVGYPLWLYMMNSSSYGRRICDWRRYIGKTWDWAASNGLFDAVAQVL